MDLSKIKCGAKILYYADACEKFAEHELDYILFVKVAELAPFTVNPDEVRQIAWVSRTQLDDFIAHRLREHGEDITPWFRLLKERRLDQWWQKLEREDKLPDEAERLDRFTD